jgi:predicted NBD/HSP70 family sugar kinase
LALVMQSLFNESQLTRADLARQTGLTKVTISDLVAELIDDGFVQETGLIQGARPGKPAAGLAVREDQHDIVAVDLSALDVFRAGVYSLKGQCRMERNVALAGRTGDEAVEAAFELIARCMEDADRRILGIGIGSPGTVDAEGRVISAPNIGWNKLALQDKLSQRFTVPVAVLNDANAAVIAETAFADAANDLIRVQITRGVGAGILVAGSLVLGTSAAGGEIGHVVIEHRGAICSCGKRGCLETWISAPALRRRLLADESNHNSVLAEAGRRLGMALSPIVAALDLQEIVVGGPAELIAGPFLDACQSLLIERTHSEFRRDPTVKTSTLGNDAVLLGAVSLVLRTTLGVS